MTIMKRIFLSLLLIALCAEFSVSCKSNQTAAETTTAAATIDADNTKKDIDVTVLKDITTDDGVREVSVRPSGVCSSQIDIAVKDNIIRKVTFTNGCPGNTQGVAILLEGMSVSEAISKIGGIDCAGKGTSCPDQLSKALEYILM